MNLEEKLEEALRLIKLCQRDKRLRGQKGVHVRNKVRWASYKIEEAAAALKVSEL